MTLTAANWPEPLPEPSPPPAAERAPVGARRTMRESGFDPDDPGHLMTAQEWTRVREDAAELQRLEREAAEDAT